MISPLRWVTSFQGMAGGLLPFSPPAPRTFGCTEHVKHARSRKGAPFKILSSKRIDMVKKARKAKLKNNHKISNIISHQTVRIHRYTHCGVPKGCRMATCKEHLGFRGCWSSTVKPHSMPGKNLGHAAVALPKCTSCRPKGQELLTCWCEWTLPPALHASVQCALIVWLCCR